MELRYHANIKRFVVADSDISFFIDIDECATGTHKCTIHDVCNNTHGSHNCVRKSVISLCTDPSFPSVKLGEGSRRRWALYTG